MCVCVLHKYMYINMSKNHHEYLHIYIYERLFEWAMNKL